MDRNRSVAKNCDRKKGDGKMTKEEMLNASNLWSVQGSYGEK